MPPSDRDHDHDCDLVALDPGKGCVGLARFDADGRLVACAAVYPVKGRAPGIGPYTRMIAATVAAVCAPSPPARLIVEKMQMRRKVLAAVPRLLELTYITGAVVWGVSCAGGASAELVDPGVWTKRRPKAVNHKRIRKRLDSEELGILDTELARTLAGNRKEVLDAVGIGLWAYKRLG